MSQTFGQFMDSSKGREAAAVLLRDANAEVKRLEDLILQIDHDTYCDEGGYGPAHPEAQAIRTRREKVSR